MKTISSGPSWRSTKPPVPRPRPIWCQRTGWRFVLHLIISCPGEYAHRRLLYLVSGCQLEVCGSCRSQWCFVLDVSRPSCSQHCSYSIGASCAGCPKCHAHSAQTLGLGPAISSTCPPRRKRTFALWVFNTLMFVAGLIESSGISFQPACSSGTSIFTLVWVIILNPVLKLLSWVLPRSTR